MSYSKYPGAIDDNESMPETVDLVTELKAEVVNRLRDGIIATETTIGVNPADGYATLKDRLNAMQAEIDAGVSAHASTHEYGGSDEITIQNLGSGASLANKVVVTDGAGGLTLEDYSSGISGSGTDRNVATWDAAGTGLRDNPQLKVNADGIIEVTANYKIGIGTSTVPRGGIGGAKLALHGQDDSSANGPNIQFTTTIDNYPIIQILPQTHGSSYIFFDAYNPGGTWESSHVGGNFMIGKIWNTLYFKYDSGVTPGDTVNWNDGFSLNPSCNLTLGNATGGENSLKLREAPGDPTNAASYGHVYVKDVSGIAELFYMDDTSQAVQLTSNGGPGGGFTAGGDLTGDETTQTVSYIRGIPSPDPADASNNKHIMVEATTAPAFENPRSVAYDGDYVWVARAPEDRSAVPEDPVLYVFDAATREFVAQYDYSSTGATHGFRTINIDDNYVYATTWDDDHVAIIDKTDGSVVGWAYTQEKAYDAISDNLGNLYVLVDQYAAGTPVAPAGLQKFVISGCLGQPRSTKTYDALLTGGTVFTNGTPRQLEFGGGYIWAGATVGTNNLYKISPSTFTVVAKNDTDGFGTGQVFDLVYAFGYIWATTYGGGGTQSAVLQYDVNTLAVLNQIFLTTCEGSGGICVGPDTAGNPGTRLWVTDADWGPATPAIHAINPTGPAYDTSISLGAANTRSPDDIIGTDTHLWVPSSDRANSAVIGTMVIDPTTGIDDGVADSLSLKYKQPLGTDSDVWTINQDASGTSFEDASLSILGTHTAGVKRLQLLNSPSEEAAVLTYSLNSSAIGETNRATRLRLGPWADTESTSDSYDCKLEMWAHNAGDATWEFWTHQVFIDISAKRLYWGSPGPTTVVPTANARGLDYFFQGWGGGNSDDTAAGGDGSSFTFYTGDGGNGTADDLPGDGGSFRILTGDSGSNGGAGPAAPGYIRLDTGIEVSSGNGGSILIGDIQADIVTIGNSDPAVTINGELYIDDGGSGTDAFLDLVDGASAAVSAAGHVRLRSNAGALEASQNGGAYASLGGISGSGTDNHLVRWDGTGAVQDTGWTINDSDDLLLPSAGVVATVGRIRSRNNEFSIYCRDGLNTKNIRIIECTSNNVAIGSSGANYVHSYCGSGYTFTWTRGSTQIASLGSFFQINDGLDFILGSTGIPVSGNMRTKNNFEWKSEQAGGQDMRIMYWDSSNDLYWGDSSYVVDSYIDALTSVNLRVGSTPRIVTNATGIGFFNTTPVAQPSTTGTTAGFTPGTGTPVNDDSTFTGNTGTAAYTIGDIVKALKDLGLLAA